MLIYIKGPLGYETAYRLYEANIVQIKKQFPQFFIKRFLEIRENMDDFHIEKYSEDNYIREILSGGLYAGLWEVLEKLKKGCVIDHKKIPLAQETVEVLELFKESPYEVSSKGCFLIVSERFIPDAALIGFTNETRDRIMDFGSHKRYLTPPLRQRKDILVRKGNMK